MDEASHSEGFASERGRGAWIWVLVAAFVVVLYVLSTGPIAKLNREGIISLRTFQTLYAPLAFLDQHSPVVSSFFTWYIGKLWGVS